MNIYSLYSNSGMRYNLPFFAEDDSAAIDQVSKMVAAQADPALLSSLDDLQIEFIGSYVSDSTPEDIEDGAIPLCGEKPVVVMDDLHKNLPLPPTLKARLDKFYGGDLNA